MIHRIISTKLSEAALQYPVLTITGPRQSGKTTVAKAVFPDYEYISLEDPDNQRLADEDPRGFLSMHRGNLILDEAQRVPSLFSYIQTIVDQEDRRGRFVLTGSHNFLLMEKVTQSLAGRCAIFHLLPFSRAELKNTTAPNLNQIENLVIKIEEAHEDLDEMLFTGSYPRIHDRQLKPQEWLQDYLYSYIERDVRLISNIGSIETFQRFMSLCATTSGQILNIASLANDCDISPATVKKWLSILECSFIIKLLRPHYKNFNKRLIKRPKLYFLDTGLLCHLLKIRSPQSLQQHSARGAIFETWVISEVLKSFYNQRQEPDMYYWRDSNANEVDLLIERDDLLLPIGIKSSQTFNDKLIKELRFWRKLTQEPNHPGILVYGGENQIQYQGINIIPWYVW